VLFERGAFDVAARQLTATVLVGLAVGLPLQILGYSLARALSAVGRNRVLAAWTIASLTAQMVVQLVGVPLLGPIAIGLGPSVAGLVLASGLAVVLGRGGQLGRFVLATAPATAVTAIALVVAPVPVVVQGGVVALAWAVNLAAVRSTREIMASEIPRLVRDALRRSPGKVGAR
jgi:peptidoglycan biosynthesis protein MviN/MurJ (putative lipid II flippase)